MTNLNDPKIIVALDFDNYDDAMNLVKQCDPKLCKFKIGKELFTRCGPRLIEDISNLDFKIFLDLKFHDIPNTVAKALKSAASFSGVWMVDVHASGGPAMLEAAANALANIKDRPLLIGVTVLTSMDDNELKAIGINCSASDQVKRLATLAKNSGLDGVVSSAQEVAMLKDTVGSDFVYVTPGIRPVSMQGSDDQKRVMTAYDAIKAGASYLVIGRPITKAQDKMKALIEFNEEVNRALAGK